MENFKETINRNNLIDPSFIGSKFTWKRGNSQANRIRERLDRFLVNQEMAKEFKNIRVNHQNFNSSDHRPILATLTKTSGFQRQKRRNFRNKKFEKAWLSFPESRSLIEEAWKKVEGSDLIAFQRRLNLCLSNLSSWNKERLEVPSEVL